jgi:type IV pilus assembly protein PilB
MGDKGSLMDRLLGNAEKFSDKQVAETLQLLVAHGFKRGASDIHIEPHDRFVLVRFRIDGALRGTHKLPRQTLGTVMAELKKLAGLQVQETRMPQEGQYDVTVDEQDINIHLSVMLVFGGEKAVLHLSVRMGKPGALQDLGFWGANLKALQAILATPHGLVAIAAPRHNGVSSTLFSLVDQLNSPMVSIATIELRAKHRLPGVSHTYLAANGMNVHDGLQAALKQDPNVVVLGDMPDRATAELAIHAATTGHLVIASFCADNAVAAALRMRAAGAEPFLLVTALRATVSQRLVRTLCPDCRQRHALSVSKQKELAEQFKITGPAAYKRISELERAAANAGFGDAKQLNSSPAGITHLWRADPYGCETCEHSGFVGRTAIVEVLANSEQLHKALMDSSINAIPAVQRAVLKDGFVPMALDGLVKALRGETTVTEVLRAAGATLLA